MGSIKRTDSIGFPLNIAVIGAGISGICTAYLLQKKHRVTLYEKNDYFGGDTHTVMIPDGPDRGPPVDTGGIVLNPRKVRAFLDAFRGRAVKQAPVRGIKRENGEITLHFKGGRHPWGPGP